MRVSSLAFWTAIRLAWLTALATTPILAAPPQADWLFPAGAARGTGVTVTVGGAFERWPAKAWTNRDDVTVEPAPEKGQLVVTVAVDAVPGPCWVRLFDEEGSATPRSFVVGLVPEILEAEPNNEPRAPQTVPATGVTINGQFNPSGDVDVFAVAMTQGQSLVAALEANGALGSPLDGVLQVLSPAGFVLEQNDDCRGLDPRVVYTAPSDGVYLVRAFCFPAIADSSIVLAGGAAYVYRLTLTAGGYIDHPFPLAAPAAQPGEVDLAGWNLPETGGRLLVPPAADPSSTDSQLVTLLHPLAANACQVFLEPHPTAREEGPTSVEQPQDLALPITVSGQLDSEDDSDVYRFSARQGESLAFRLDSRRLGFPLDAVLTLTDDAGKVLARVDDAPDGRPDPVLTQTIPVDGAYCLTVTDLTHRGGPRRLYRLVAGPTRPDCALKVTADAFTLVAGTPLEIPVTVERQAGLAAEIELLIEGLPDGVSCPPVRSLPQGDTATAVKLVLTGGGAPYSGPIRIVGRPLDVACPPRSALAPGPTDMLALDRLWLTVRAP